MKKFGPYMGVTANRKKPAAQSDTVNSTDAQAGEETTYPKKPDLSEIQRRYEAFIERHERLSEELEREFAAEQEPESELTE
ncbi:MAG: hypothetical protein ACOX3U_07960 [Christensenellales bacterium]|jgi:hypothetical protein